MPAQAAKNLPRGEGLDLISLALKDTKPKAAVAHAEDQSLTK